jgi:hypothetical protein
MENLLKQAHPFSTLLHSHSLAYTAALLTILKIDDRFITIAVYRMSTQSPGILVSGYVWDSDCLWTTACPHCTEYLPWTAICCPNALWKETQWKCCRVKWRTNHNQSQRIEMSVSMQRHMCVCVCHVHFCRMFHSSVTEKPSNKRACSGWMIGFPEGIIHHWALNLL